MKEKSFVQHFLVLGGSSFVNILLGFFSVPIITRFVNRYDYGQFNLFMVYGSIALVVVCLGLDQSFVRYFYADKAMGYKRNIFINCLKYPIYISVPLAILFILITNLGLINFDFNLLLSLLLVLYVVILVIQRFCNLLLRVEYKTGNLARAVILQKVIFIAVALLFIIILRRQQVLVLVLATIVSCLISTFYAFFVNRELLFSKERNSTPINMKEQFRFGLPLIVSMGITTLLTTIDRLVLRHHFGFGEVGIYATAISLIAVFTIIQSTFNTLWIPKVVEHYEKGKNSVDDLDRSFYQRGNQIITILMFFIGLSVILFKDWYALLLGPQFREAASIIPFLVFVPIMFTISESTCIGIVIKEKSEMHIIVAIGACLTNLIANLVLVPMYGGRGAAMAAALSYIVLWTLRTILSNRLFYVDYRLLRIGIMIVYTFLFALYNTFNSFDVVILVAYLMGLVLMSLLYYDTLKFILRYGLDYINKRKKWKR